MPDTTDQEPDDYLSTSEAARHLGVSIRTLYRYEDAGHVTPDRLPSGRRRYRRGELDNLRQRKPRAEVAS